MHPAAKFQFERAVREFSQWRAVPADERSPAPAWWWQPAFEVAGQQEEMPSLSCYRLELPPSSTYAAGAAVLMATLVDQTSLPWPDEFPRKIERAEKKLEESWTCAENLAEERRFFLSPKMELVEASRAASAPNRPARRKRP
jgi:hypothetical protein